MIIKANQYTIELLENKDFNAHASIVFNPYQKSYITHSEYISSTKIGIRIIEGERVISSAIIGALGGGTGIGEQTYIIEKDRILLCCSNSIFCLSIPNLDLIWEKQVDNATCFQIFKHQDDYLVHGELEVSKLDRNGSILWQFRGKDIFVNLEGENAFKIERDFIRIIDFNNIEYWIDFNGGTIKESTHKVHS